MQLQISDLHSTVICVEVTIRFVFGGLGAKKACSTQAETNQRHLYVLCSASRAYHSALAQVVLPAELVLLIRVTVC